MRDFRVNEMDVIFIQHQMDMTKDTQQFFVQNGLIAIHYLGDLISGKDRCSSNPDDYEPRARKVLRRLWHYCEKGCLAVGYYNSYPPIRMIIGVIPPDSKIKPELRDLWVNKEYADGKTCYKTVQLENFFEVDLSKNRQLESCLPRGNVVVKWSVNEIDRTIRYLYNLHHGLVSKKDRSVNDLSYSQLEVLCSEYLRHTNEDFKVDFFITPIGRSQKSTDIDGISKNKNVLAQISFSTNDSEIKEKMENLLNYRGDNTILLYFGPVSKKGLIKTPIKYIPIEQAFEKMKNTSLIEYV